jgi:hypothetical protein
MLDIITKPRPSFVFGLIQLLLAFTIAGRAFSTGRFEFELITGSPVLSALLWLGTAGIAAVGLYNLVNSKLVRRIMGRPARPH